MIGESDLRSAIVDSELTFSISRTSIRTYGEEDRPCEEAEFVNDDWKINISNLDELRDLVRKYGKIIIFPDNSLEIYDDYRD